MKKFTLIFIAFTFSLSFFFISCSSKKVGFFNNTYPHYSIKTRNQSPVSPALAASTENNKPSDLHKAAFADEIENVKAPQNFPAKKGKSIKVNTENNSDNPVRKLTKAESREIKNYIKENLNDNKNNATNLGKGILVVIAILLPPLAVALVDGITGPFWLSILLTLLFYIPGLVYALFRIFRTK